MRDTTPEAEKIWLDAIRRMPPADRLRQALAFSEAMHRVTLAGLRRMHPGKSDLELVELALGVTLIPRGDSRR